MKSLGESKESQKEVEMGSGEGDAGYSQLGSATDVIEKY